MNEKQLTSLELLSVALDIPQDEPVGIFQNLRKAIENIVRVDGNEAIFSSEMVKKKSL